MRGESAFRAEVDVLNVVANTADLAGAGPSHVHVDSEIWFFRNLFSRMKFVVVKLAVRSWLETWKLFFSNSW